jgi:uncharacterized membrane protein/glutaredoxin
MHITVYTKPGCHLCDDALDLLDRLAPRYALQVEQVNILEDPALYEAYATRIPVIEIEGGKGGILEAPIEEAHLRFRLELARRSPPASTSASATMHVASSSTSAASVPPVPFVPGVPGVPPLAGGAGLPGEPLIDRIASGMARRWLRWVSIGLAIFVGLPWLAPVLAALGWWGPANFIYTAYAATCHQLPERAANVLGYQVAFCWRDTSIYTGLLLFGLLYGLARDHNIGWLRWMRRPIRLWVFILFLVPMAVDGFTHMFGLRDMYGNPNMDIWYGLRLISMGSQMFSFNWWMRIITGLLAALGAVWFAYPRMNRAVEEAEALRQLYRQSAMVGRPVGTPGHQTAAQG